MKEELVYLGVDIAKSHLDAAIGAQKHRFCNDTVGHRQLVRWIEQTEAAVQVICESSGGYERRLVQGLLVLGSKSVWSKPTGFGNLRGRRESWLRPIALTRKYCASLAR